MKTLKHMKTLKFLASLKLAVIVIVAIAIISAVGTVYEARYDAEVAQKLVYHSFWMYLIMGTLCINLIAVMVDRWPWKQHHTGFVLAHIGIIILLLGSLITQKFGIDGNMAFSIGEESRNVVIRERDFFVYASFDGQAMQRIYSGAPDFLKNPPSQKQPFKINLGSDVAEIFEYHHFAFRQSEIIPSQDIHDPPAVRFQLENANVNLTEWLKRDRTQKISEIDLGPAKVVFAEQKPAPSGRNEIVLITKPKSLQMDYVIYNKDRSLRSQGKIEQGQTIATGWMGLKLRVLRFLPNALEKVQYIPSGSSPMANSALRFKFRDQDYWLGLNSVLRIYLEDRIYLFSYGHRRLQLDFPLRLIDFRVGNYQGTQRAASYESEVDVPGQGKTLISMNEPLKHQGFTFYQASFERDERGQPVTSVLSVNYDPGRWIKYLGSLLMVLGSVVLFYFKRVQWFGLRASNKKK